MTRDGANHYHLVSPLTDLAMADITIHALTIPPTYAGQRLDSVLAALLPDYSRSRLQEWIRQGRVSMNGQPAVTRFRVVGGEEIEIQPPEDPVVTEAAPENVPLKVLFEDEHLIVIEKGPDLVMHPAAGNWSGTVLNGLLFHYPEVASIPRAGIVHRLDKDTSGLFVVARSLLAHVSLVEQLQTRSMGREYFAVVEGTMVSGGTVDAAIGRHASDRKRMAVNTNGKSAITHYRLAEKFDRHTAITCRLESGRTHQIRVHMTSINHPLVGDVTYGRRRYPRGLTEEAKQFVHDFPRQALHAKRLRLQHPASGDSVEWESAIPDDINDLLQALRQTQH